MARRDDDEGFNFDDVEEAESTPAALDATEVAAPEVSKMRNLLNGCRLFYCFEFYRLLKVKVKF